MIQVCAFICFCWQASGPWYEYCTWLKVFWNFLLHNSSLLFILSYVIFWVCGQCLRFFSQVGFHLMYEHWLSNVVSRLDGEYLRTCAHGCWSVLVLSKKHYFDIPSHCITWLLCVHQHIKDRLLWCLRRTFPDMTGILTWPMSKIFKVVIWCKMTVYTAQATKFQYGKTTHCHSTTTIVCSGTEQKMHMLRAQSLQMPWTNLTSVKVHKIQFPVLHNKSLFPRTEMHTQATASWRFV